MKMHYYVKEHMEPKDAYEITAPQLHKWNSEALASYASWAEWAAADYFHGHDGWDCVWPLTFVLIDRDNVEHHVKVEMEAKPVFTAEEI